MNMHFFTAVSAAVLTLGTVFAQETTVKGVITNNTTHDGSITVYPPKGDIPANRTTPNKAYGASHVETKLNVDIKEDTKKVHFIRDISDPFVVTKAYLIKNANVFILRGVLKSIVAGTIADNPVAIESIEYNDGQGVLLVSAEEYRFKDAGNGMSMDELVASLDKKGLPNSSGTVDMAYFPKYNRAEDLLMMMQESGIGFTGIAQAVHIVANSDNTNAVTYMQNGLHVLPFAYGVTDKEMNAIIMTAPGLDMREGLSFLKEIDVPVREIQLSYKLIEVYAENDQKLGLDFQAWKNNDGIDLFSAGGKYGTNWSNHGLTPNNGYRYSEYYNFNPKWNTKYLDFLTVCGKAKIVSSGTLQIADRSSANLTLADGLFAIVGSDIEGDTTVDAYQSDSKEVVTKKTETDPETGETKTTTTTTVSGKATPQSEPYSIPWTLQKLLPIGNPNGNYEKMKETIPVSVLSTTTLRSGRTQEIEVTDGTLFRFSIAGNVQTQAAILNLALSSTSIIGWDGQGQARLTESSYRTTIQIAADKKEFVVGGLTKSSVVRSVAGIPFLKDIPGLGWLFSTETDTVKKSQFVLVASAEVVTPKSAVPKETSDKLDIIKSKVEKSVKSPMGTLGFQQLLIDKDTYGDGKKQDNAKKQDGTVKQNEVKKQGTAK